MQLLVFSFDFSLCRPMSELAN